AAVSGRFEGAVDLGDARLALEERRDVRYGARRRWHAQGRAVEYALELREDLGDGLRGARRGRDDVGGGVAGAAQVLVGRVEDALVVRVGVHRGHERLLHAEDLVEDLHDGGKRVSRA